MALHLSANEPGRPGRRWLKWLTKGSLAIADQSIFALSNFLVNILLARWLSPADYGAFALAYSAFLSLLLAHNALMTTPMLVFGQGKYRDIFSDYLGTLCRAHFALTLAASALLSLAALVLSRMASAALGWVFIALAISAPFILLLWLLRRAFYAQLEPAWAALSGMVYLAIFVAGTAWLHNAGLLTPSSAVLCMGAASLFTALLLLLKLRPRFSGDVLTMRAVTADHWSYGKWVAAGAIPNWVTENIYFIVLPASFGLAQAGALKAMLNLAQPASQSISALGVLLMPILVRDLQAGGTARMARTMRMANALFLCGSVAYLTLLWVFRAHIVHSLYGDKFAMYSGWPVLAAGLIPLAQGLPNVAGAALGAVERPRLGFWADLWSAGFAIILGVPLAYWLGAGGALLGIALAYGFMGVLTFALYQRSLRQDSAGNLKENAAVPGPPVSMEGA